MSALMASQTFTRKENTAILKQERKSHSPQSTSSSLPGTLSIWCQNDFLCSLAPQLLCLCFYCQSSCDCLCLPCVLPLAHATLQHDSLCVIFKPPKREKQLVLLNVLPFKLCFCTKLLHDAWPGCFGVL